jgi:hypothetical protein
MLKVKVTREFFQKDRTFGELEVFDGDEELFSCATCEDAVRGNGDPATVNEWKIKGETAIPYGTYALRLTWSRKFGRMMWQICDVPGYIGIRIHAGNTDKDTEGCILVGDHINGNYEGISNSKATLERFMAVMAQHNNAADASIEITEAK